MVEKVVMWKGVRYYISDKDALISVVHELARQGATISEIARATGLSERKVKQLLMSC